MERTWARLTEEIIGKALNEDIGERDITTEATIDKDIAGTAYLFSKDEGVLAGIDVAMKVFHIVDPAVHTTTHFKDGDAIRPGLKIADIEGPVASILKAERLSLNLLGRMSGIASTTARYVKQINGCHAKILDTRKTMPTMRHLDKYAVRVGGGSNHRFGLYDMVLIKDNHIAVAGGIRIAVEMVTEYLNGNPDSVKIEVECKSYEEVLEAVYTAVDIIMLDNMEIADIEKSVGTIRELSAETGRKIRVEASGDITESNVRQIAETGVDYISVGSLTHSVINHDFSLLFDEL